VLFQKALSALNVMFIKLYALTIIANVFV